MASTSLIHETDLVVSINDLDNLFNSDEDDLAVSRDLQLPKHGLTAVFSHASVPRFILPLISI